MENATASISDLSCNVISAAQARGINLVTAESCTAGALATLLADTPGAGDVLQGGFVTYAKTCKESDLKVPLSLIESNGVVSEAVAVAMARGALELCPLANVAVSVTCVAGPEPDEDGNPVGLTSIAVYDRDGGYSHVEGIFSGASNGRVRGEVLRHALTLILSHLRGAARGPLS
jgi:nicotinamide-nucleotide amidase